MPRCKLHAVALAAALASAAPALAQRDAAAGEPRSADEVIARSVAARGGLSAIRAVQSVRMSGRITMGETEAPIVVELKRPASLRTEMTFDGRAVVQAYDGRQAWALPPTGEEAVALPAEAARQMKQQADIEGALVDYASKGHQVELVGKVRLQDGEAWRLKLTSQGGEVEHYLIDARSFLLVRVEASRQVGGQRIEGVTTIGGYKAVAGWKWAHSIVNQARGLPAQRLTFDKVEVNPLLEDARFRMPGRRPAPPR